MCHVRSKGHGTCDSDADRKTASEDRPSASLPGDAYFRSIRSHIVLCIITINYNYDKL